MLTLFNKSVGNAIFWRLSSIFEEELTRFNNFVFQGEKELPRIARIRDHANENFIVCPNPFPYYLQG